MHDSSVGFFVVGTNRYPRYHRDQQSLLLTVCESVIHALTGTTSRTTVVAIDIPGTVQYVYDTST